MLHRELGRWSEWTSSALLGVEAVRACRRLGEQVAVHLATALSIGGDLGAAFSYDDRLGAAAAAAGLRVLAPD